jgi:hypothetical protein
MFCRLTYCSILVDALANIFPDRNSSQVVFSLWTCRHFLDGKGRVSVAARLIHVSPSKSRYLRARAQYRSKQVIIIKDVCGAFDHIGRTGRSKEDAMTIRSLALGGMTTLLMMLSAAASVPSVAHIGSPLSAEPVAAQRDWKYFDCQTDDGYGRHRPCDAQFKSRHKK